MRHESFRVPEFVTLAKAHEAAIVFADSAKHPAIADVTADFVYARLQRTKSGVPTGYTPAALKKWLACARTWEEGGAPKDLPLIGSRPQRRSAMSSSI